MQSSSILFSSTTASTSSRTQALSRKEQALKYMSQLETAFKDGAYGAPDKPFEDALRRLLSLLKSCLGGVTAFERMDNPTHLVVRLLTLMSEDALRNLSDEALRTEYAAAVHAALDLVVIQSYEERWVNLPKALHTAQGEVGILSIVTEFYRGDVSIPRQYELDCCKENIQALMEKKSDWTRALDIIKLAISKDVAGLLTYANELRKEIRPLWPVTVLLMRRLVPLAQQSSQVLTFLQAVMAKECQRTKFHCHYAAQEALAEVIAFSQGTEKKAVRRQALGQRVLPGETEAVRKQPTYWYWVQTRPPEKKSIPGVSRKQKDRCRYRLIQGVGELLVQELENKEKSKDDVLLNQLIEMLFYLQKTEPAYLKKAQGWVQALSDKVHKDKPKAIYLTGFSEAHPSLEKTHLADEQKRLEAELRCMQLDAKAQQAELAKVNKKNQQLEVACQELLRKEEMQKQQETILLQDKTKLEEDKAALTKRAEVDQEQLESLQRECTRLKRKLDTAEINQQELSEELSNLKQKPQAEALQGRVQKLTEELKEEQSKVKQLSALMDAYSKELQEIPDKEKTIENERVELALWQQALEKREKKLAEQAEALKLEREELATWAKVLKKQEAQLKEQADELCEREASLRSLEEVFKLQLQDIEQGIKKLLQPVTTPPLTSSHSATLLPSPDSRSLAQILASIRPEPFDEVFRRQLEDLSDDEIDSDCMCPVLKRPAYDALTLRLMTKEGYEEEHLISEEAARGWLIDQEKTTCPCGCDQEVLGISINRYIRKSVRKAIESASSKSPTSTSVFPSAKLVVIGDSRDSECANLKTTFLIALTMNAYPGENPSPFDNYSITSIMDGRVIYLDICDTCCIEDYDRLRPLSYPGTDLFLLLFSIISPSTFDRIKSKWYPEIQLHAPGVPILLIGLQAHLRDDQSILRRLAEKEQHIVTLQEATSLAQQIGAVEYLECSAVTLDGLHTVLCDAARIALGYRSVKEKLPQPLYTDSLPKHEHLWPKTTCLTVSDIKHEVKLPSPVTSEPPISFSVAQLTSPHSHSSTTAMTSAMLSAPSPARSRTIIAPTLEAARPVAEATSAAGLSSLITPAPPIQSFLTAMEPSSPAAHATQGTTVPVVSTDSSSGSSIRPAGSYTL